jgi:hypothetical protein
VTLPPYGPPPPRPTDGMAVASLVVGIVGIVITILAPVCGPIALVMGVKAKKRITESGGMIEGAGLAQAGFVLGIIATVMGALGIVLFGICMASFASMGY